MIQRELSEKSALQSSQNFIRASPDVSESIVQNGELDIGFSCDKFENSTLDCTEKFNDASVSESILPSTPEVKRSLSSHQPFTINGELLCTPATHSLSQKILSPSPEIFFDFGFQPPSLDDPGSGVASYVTKPLSDESVSVIIESHLFYRLQIEFSRLDSNHIYLEQYKFSALEKKVIEQVRKVNIPEFKGDLEMILYPMDQKGYDNLIQYLLLLAIVKKFRIEADVHWRKIIGTLSRSRILSYNGDTTPNGPLDIISTPQRQMPISELPTPGSSESCHNSSLNFDYRNSFNQMDTMDTKLEKADNSYNSLLKNMPPISKRVPSSSAISSATAVSTLSNKAKFTTESSPLSKYYTSHSVFQYQETSEASKWAAKNMEMNVLTTKLKYQPNILSSNFKEIDSKRHSKNSPTIAKKSTRIPASPSLVNNMPIVRTPVSSATTNNKKLAKVEKSKSLRKSLSHTSLKGKALDEILSSSIVPPVPLSWENEINDSIGFSDFICNINSTDQISESVDSGLGGPNEYFMDDVMLENYLEDFNDN